MLPLARMLLGSVDLGQPSLSGDPDAADLRKMLPFLDLIEIEETLVAPLNPFSIHIQGSSVIVYVPGLNSLR
jgi:hypothetical protein